MSSTPSQYASAFGLDAVEQKLMSSHLDDVLAQMVRSDRPTVPPPASYVDISDRLDTIPCSAPEFDDEPITLVPSISELAA